MTRFTIAGVFLMISTTANANLILNGSFEENGAATTEFNNSNRDLTELVSNVFAFGGSEEIDLSTGNGFFGSAVDGDWFLSLHTRPDTKQRDELSIELASSLMIGQAYELSFYVTGFFNGDRGVEIGVSSVPNSFGLSIFSSDLYSNEINEWRKLTTTFVATDNWSYVTVASGETLDAVASVDQFSLVTVPMPGTTWLIFLALACMYTKISKRSNSADLSDIYPNRFRISW